MGLKDFVRRFAAMSIRVSLGAAGLVLLSGWIVAQEPIQEVKQGDRVALHFLCRLPGGELAASSRAGAEVGTEVVKSPLFLPRAKGDPVVVLTGQSAAEADAQRLRDFEEEILRQLAKAVVGLKVGKRCTLQIGAASSTSHPKEYLLQIARVRKRPKTLHMPLSEYETQKGSTPTVGMPYTIDPAFPGRITTVTAEEVVISFSPPSEGLMETPFGRATLKEVGNHFQMEIDARKGTLVRSGPYAGRITEVSEQLITVDYSHPFGGEVLTCEVMVISTDSPALDIPN